MRHREGNMLKWQAYGERIRVSPLNPGECEKSVSAWLLCRRFFDTRPCWSSQGATIRLIRVSGSRGGHDLAEVSLSNCRRRASHPRFVPRSGISPLWNATIWGHEKAQTSGPEMVQKRFCFRQDA